MTQASGRFAPSPTGPLHAGSLLAALASFLDARKEGIPWRVRMDDLDRARVVPGSEQAILAALSAHGLHLDGAVARQSDHVPRYEAALQALARSGRLFYCTCSRSRLAGTPHYPGTCRGRVDPRPDAAVRIRVDDAPVRYHDLIAGPRSEVLSRTCGDFVIRRRDGIVAYQLATAVDDGQPAIGRVIRGGDLLDNTARQVFLMRQLGLTVPVYAHLPILTWPDGAKLSKQTHAPALDTARPTANLLQVLPHLGIDAPEEAAGWPPDRLLAWAAPRFHLRKIRGGPRIFRA